MKNNSQIALDLIKKQQIKPIPKKYFVIKNIIFWIFFIALLLLGSLSFGLIVFMITNNNWDNPILYLPYFWLSITLIFIIFSYLSFKKTKNSYRLNYLFFPLTNLFASIFLGLLIYFSGYSYYLDNYFQQTFPSYSKNSAYIKSWNNPDSGYLAGTIINVSPQRVILEDISSHQHWNLKYSESQMFYFYLGQKVKIVGKNIGINTFEVSQIYPIYGCNCGKKCGCIQHLETN